MIFVFRATDGASVRTATVTFTINSDPTFSPTGQIAATIPDGSTAGMLSKLYSVMYLSHN